MFSNDFGYYSYDFHPPCYDFHPPCFDIATTPFSSPSSQKEDLTRISHRFSEKDEQSVTSSSSSIPLALSNGQCSRCIENKSNATSHSFFPRIGEKCGLTDIKIKGFIEQMNTELKNSLDNKQINFKWKLNSLKELNLETLKETTKKHWETIKETYQIFKKQLECFFIQLEEKNPNLYGTYKTRKKQELQNIGDLYLEKSINIHNDILVKIFKTKLEKNKIIKTNDVSQKLFLTKEIAETILADLKIYINNICYLPKGRVSKEQAEIVKNKIEQAAQLFFKKFYCVMFTREQDRY